jgi:3-oxoacyl-[acyl-carrier-protein] synthase II
MSTRQVAIAGYGLVSPIGNDLSSLDRSLFEHHSAIGIEDVTIEGQDALTVALARCALHTENYPTPSKLFADRATALALESVEKCIVNSGIDLDQVNRERLGVFWGSGMAGAASFDDTTRVIYKEHKRIRPTSVISSMPSTPASEIALKLKAQGACITYANACASSGIAIGEGLRAIRSGDIDVAIVGGSESMLTPGLLSAWNALRVMVPVRNKVIADLTPFSSARSGFAMGEGAAALMLVSPRIAEQLSLSKDSNLFISGYANNSDGHHITNPNPLSQARVMRLCLANAGLQPKDIGYINAHGTGTQLGDASEAKAINDVFTDLSPWVSSTKALHGHLLGASGAVEMIACLRALTLNQLPANSIHADIDPSLQIRVVNEPGRSEPNLSHVMSNSFAFGGTNACLIISKKNDLPNA